MNWSDLIKEAKQGSASAQKCLYDELAAKMYLVCQRFVKLPEDAEEIMLDGFYAFFKSISRFDYESDPAMFVYIKRIMINHCLMFLRKKSGFAVVSDSVAEEVPFPQEAFSNLGTREILDMIIRLPVGYRTVFNLHVIEGFSHAEISGMLSIGESTSRSQLAKAKQLLQKMFIQQSTAYATDRSK